MRLVYEHLTDIPSNFTEVEYLESSGTQYIDTGVKATNKTKAIVKSVGMTWVFGGRTSLSYGDAFGVCLGQNSAYLQFGNQSITYSKTNIKNDIVLLENSQDGCYINGVKQATYNTQTFTGTNNIYLFNLNDNNSLNDGLIGKIWFSKIYEDGVLVRDFVPCLDNNSVPCMYDKVEGKAYYNLGTGSFTYGRKIIPVEYLESSGTQWIKTGIFPTNEMEFESKFTFTSLVSTNLTIIGSRDSTKRCQPIGAYNNKWSASIGGSYDANGSSVSANTSYVVKSIISNGQTITLTVNGNQASVCTSTTGLPNQELYIFGRNFYGNTDPVDSRINAKMYFMKIKAGNVLVRDFVPCKDENNVGFMFDRVTHTAYLNAGTGSFITGSVKPKKKLRLIRESKRRLPKGFKEVEYLQSSGTQYIDTGYIASNTSGFKVDIMPLQASDRYFIGSRPRLNSDDRFLAGSNSGPQVYIGWNTNTFVNWTLNNVHTVQNNFMNSRTKVLDGTTIAQITSNLSSQNTRTVYLFSANDANAVSMDICRIYKVQISEGSVLVRDFIPCLDASNIPCMYDLVEGKAYYNTGTGSFSYGHTITPVEYLESTGTQYIDTGVVAKSGLSANLTFEYTALSTTSISMLDARSGDNRFYLCHCGNVNGYLFYYGYGPAIQTSFTPTTNTKYNVETSLAVGSQTMKVNGNIIATGSSSTNYNLGVNLYMFGVNWTTAQYLASSKLYACKIYDGATLIRDFIPVRDENNVGYMFDKVTHSLYANAGTGAFVVGNEIKQDITRFVKDDVPNIYRKVSYLQSSGTQYIDTGFKPSDTAGYYAKFAYSETTDESTVALGARTSGQDNRWWLNISTDYEGIVFGFGGYKSSQKPTPQNTILEASCNLYNNRKYKYITQNWQGDISTPCPNVPFNAYLFAANVSGVLTLPVQNLKLYSVIFTNGSLMVRDFVPVVRKSDNKPGMYDRVSKQFFTNAGTGEFIIPN